MDDLISRATAELYICQDCARLEKEGVIAVTPATAKDWAVNVLDTVEPITKYGSWISCKDELPEVAYGEFLIAWVPKNGGDPKKKTYMEFMEFENGQWIGNIPQAGKDGFEVVAWMELPEDYVEDE